MLMEIPLMATVTVTLFVGSALATAVMLTVLPTGGEGGAVNAVGEPLSV